ncbi:MAG: UDP-glucose/iron transport system permease protein [Blastocatellia bacterium]|nr:UDP-glucose/iron transport system permease protein [Blastocatellia bacterium]
MLLLLQSSSSAASSIIDVSWFDLALAFGLILIAVSLSRWQHLGLAKDFIIGAIRTIVQLVLVGYVLVYIFAANRWYITVAALLLMLTVATFAAVGRQKNRRGQSIHWLTGTAMLLGSGFTLIYISSLVVRVHPWYDPRYMIPIFGMIVGSAMNGASIALERLAGEMEARRAEIEAYLALGANYQQAAQQPVRQALRASLIPTVNGLMVVGIVTLPGMMTGQILAGSSPLTAVRYQIVVVFMQAAAVAITTAVVTLWYRRTFFTSALQLKAGGTTGK